MVDRLIENDQIISSLQDALRRGEHGLSVVPRLVKLVIAEQRWDERTVRVTREKASFPTFDAFVRAALPEGLGTDVATLKRLCRDDLEALDAIDRAEQAASHQGERTDIVSIRNEVEVSGDDERPVGTTRQYALRRLRKDRPDLHEQVVKGAVSPHAAMVQAGFRRKTRTVDAVQYTALVEAAVALCRLWYSGESYDAWQYEVAVEQVAEALAALGALDLSTLPRWEEPS